MAELPTGTVTFVLTDIEGSTASRSNRASATAACWPSPPSRMTS